MLDLEAVEEQARTLYLDCRRRLGQLLVLRFDFCPAVERFMRWTQWVDPDFDDYDPDFEDL